jgi:hypothetical protein
MDGAITDIVIAREGNVPESYIQVSKSYGGYSTILTKGALSKKNYIICYSVEIISSTVITDIAVVKEGEPVPFNFKKISSEASFSGALYIERELREKATVYITNLATYLPKKKEFLGESYQCLSTPVSEGICIGFVKVTRELTPQFREVLLLD